MMVAMVTNNALDLQSRDKACSLLKALIEAKPTLICRAQLVPTLLQAAFSLVVEPFKTPAEETDDEATAMSPERMGVEILDTVTVSTDFFPFSFLSLSFPVFLSLFLSQLTCYARVYSAMFVPVAFLCCAYVRFQ
jgi:hypothetical protein